MPAEYARRVGVSIRAAAMSFYDFDEYEMIALELRDLDLG